MRVALLQSETRFIGGVERVTEGILRESHGDSIEWHVICLRSGLLVERIREFFPADRMAVLQAGRIRNALRTLLSIAQIARQLRRWRIDAVVSQGFHAQCYGGWAARLAGARNIFWCHNLLRPEHEGRDPVVRLALRAPADSVITAPRTNVVSLEHYYRQRCPVRLLYPAHPLEKFANGDGARIREEFRIASAAPVAAIVGRLQPWKGQDVFVRAAARVAQQLPEARFLVVGGTAMQGDSHYEGELRRSADVLGIADRVIFTGERHDVPDLIAAAEVVVHASVDPEPFGLVIIEAMAAGRAVIASNAGGPAEIVENGINGLFTTPGDDVELAAAMIRVLTDLEFRRRLERNALERATHFSFARMSAELASVLHDAIGENAAGLKASSEPLGRAE